MPTHLASHSKHPDSPSQPIHRPCCCCCLRVLARSSPSSLRQAPGCINSDRRLQEARSTQPAGPRRPLILRMAPPEGEGDAAKAGGAKEDAANAQIPDKVGRRAEGRRPGCAAPPPARTTATAPRAYKFSACGASGLPAKADEYSTAERGCSKGRQALGMQARRPSVPGVAPGGARPLVLRIGGPACVLLLYCRLTAGASGRQPAVRGGQEAGQGRLWPGLPGTTGAAHQGQGRSKRQRGGCCGARTTAALSLQLPCLFFKSSILVGDCAQR